MSQIPKSFSITTQKPAEVTDEKQQERRGLLERLGDKILQRLGKTAGADGETYFSPESVAPRLLPIAGGSTSQPISLQQTRASRKAVSSPPRNMPHGNVSNSALPLPPESSGPQKSSGSQSQGRMPYVSKVNRRVPPALVPGLSNSEYGTSPDHETSGKVVKANAASAPTSSANQELRKHREPRLIPHRVHHDR